MTKLTKPVRRETSVKYGKRHIVVILAPNPGDDIIAFRLIGRRQQYITRVADLYRLAALWHANKQRIAMRSARQSHTPWKQARKQFIRDNHVLETTKKGHAS